MQYFFYILLFLFLYFNYKIVASDLKNKIIPNKFLGYLLILIPFYYIYLFFSFPEINYLLSIGQIFLTFIISFILYSFGIWSAGDAKYLLVLSLFIPNIGIVPFIGNIALLTLLYLLLYFIYFYFGKNLFNKKYRKSLWGNIKNDLLEKSITFIKSSNGNIYKKILLLKILKWITIFLTIFVTIRLSRIYIFESLLDNNNLLIFNILEKYNIYFIILIVIIFFGTILLIKKIYIKTKYYIVKTYHKFTQNESNFLNYLDFIFIICILLGLLYFIYLEYKIDQEKILHNLYLIFTLYISIWLIVKVILYSYKITFHISELKNINIKELKKGSIVDKNYLINLFNVFNPKSTKSLNNYNKNMNYFKSIENPINTETVKNLKKIFKNTNSICLKDEITSKGFNRFTHIKVLKTFAFGGYIFVGFIITYLLEDKIFKYILENLFMILRSFY